MRIVHAVYRRILITAAKENDVTMVLKLSKCIKCGKRIPLKFWLSNIVRSSCEEVFYKKRRSTNFLKTHKKKPVLYSLLK